MFKVCGKAAGGVTHTPGHNPTPTLMNPSSPPNYTPTPSHSQSLRKEMPTTNMLLCSHSPPFTPGHTPTPSLTNPTSRMPTTHKPSLTPKLSPHSRPHSQPYTNEQFHTPGHITTSILTNPCNKPSHSRPPLHSKSHPHSAILTNPAKKMPATKEHEMKVRLR